MSQGPILAALSHGPKSGAELADICHQTSAYISRTCAKLRLEGRVKRIDGGSGRGSIATYALMGDQRAPAAPAKRSYVTRDFDVGPPHPGVTVSRDPCFFCGYRGDLPCEHRSAAA